MKLSKSDIFHEVNIYSRYTFHQLDSSHHLFLECYTILMENKLSCFRLIIHMHLNNMRLFGTDYLNCTSGFFVTNKDSPVSHLCYGDVLSY